MRLVIQRVISASVTVNNQLISEIGPGILILLGINKEDNIETAHKWAQKALNIRLWGEIQEKQEKIEKIEKLEKLEKNCENQNQNEEQKLDLDTPHKAKEDGLWKTNLMQNNFEVLVVSQFTLYGTLKGNKPDFRGSMGADEARKLYEEFINKMQKLYNPEKIKGGAFQQKMDVALVNDGPVTLVLEGVEEAKPDKLAKFREKQKQQNEKNKEKQKSNGEEKQEKNKEKQKINGEDKQEKNKQNGNSNKEEQKLKDEIKSQN